MKSSVRREFVLYGLALLLAWVVRFAFLGRLPLSDAEAGLALQALGLARGQDVLLGPHPAYLLFTGAFLWLFGSGDVVARFWPALVGGLAALAPVFFRRQLGRRAAIWLAFFLAFDPGLVTLSRQANSTPIAITFTLFALGLWLGRRPVLAGIALGLALLGGPQVWPGLLVLAVSAWAAGMRRAAAPSAAAAGEPAVEPVQDPPAWRAMGWSAGTALLLAGTLFLLFPRGLSAMAASLPAYLGVWQNSSGISIGLILAALLFYESLALIFGVIGAVTHRKHAVDRFLMVWAVAALVLAVLPPGRSPEGLLWGIIPLLALAARQVNALLRLPAGDRLPAFGQAALATVILGFVFLDLATITEHIRAQREYTPEQIALAGALILLLSTALLVAWGWSGRVAGYGVIYSLLAVTIVLAISAAWNGGGLSKRGAAEIWRAGPQFTDADLLQSTIRSFERFNLNGNFDLDTAVVGMNSPALEWALRDVENVRFVNFLPASTSPALVITQDQPELGLAAEYRGQTFNYSQQPAWNLLEPYQWLRWLYFREAPLEKQVLVLWARTDLFPEDATGQEAVPGTDSGSGIQ